MKKFLLSLVISFVWLISFWYCQTTWLTKWTEQTRWNQDYYITEDTTVSVSNWTTAFFHNNSDYDIVLCVINKDSTSVQGYYAQWSFSINGWSNNHLCYFMPYSENTRYSYMYWGAFEVDITLVSSPMTSLDCQNEYNLIPISSVDQNYCETNNLCPSWDWSCEEWDWNWSALYINNIQHQSAPLINVDIPDYIYWDYSSDEDEFNLYVGSGYDQDYIDNVIAINSYQPTSQDFTDVFVSGLTLVMPYIVIVLFIIFIRKLIKRIFK